MKKAKKLLSFFLCMLFLVSLTTPDGIYAQPSQSTHGSEAYQYITYLDQNLRERIAGTEQEAATSHYIKEELENFGYTVTATPFSYTSRNEPKNSQNLSVTKPGNSTKKIIVGAHYDSVGTAGVDDNGSGVAVVLETAKQLKEIETPYTIEFVFFGAEEVGLKGSTAYVNTMTSEHIQNTILMVNVDSVLAGTYPYIYGGVAQGNTVIKTFGVHQAKELSDKLGLTIHLNNTDLNLHYPSPSTGNWSDHAPFSNAGIAYLYLESANWELPDTPSDPQNGSSGAYQTESGPVMHKVGRDDLSFIEAEWGTRGKDNLTTFTTLLYNYLPLVSPQGLLADKTELKAVIADVQAVDISLYTKATAATFTQALTAAITLAEDDTILATEESKVEQAAKTLLTAREKLILLSEEKPIVGEKEEAQGGASSDAKEKPNLSGAHATTDPVQTGDSSSLTLYFVSLAIGLTLSLGVKKKNV